MIKYCMDCKIELKGHGNPLRCKSCANKGRNNPMFGKTHPGYMLGKKLSEETKKKISEGNKGKILSEEARKKISIARLKNGIPEWQRKIMVENRIKNGSYKSNKKDLSLEEFYGIERAKEIRRKFTKEKMSRNFSPEQIKKILRRREKSSLEIRFEDIINKLGLPYRFVGNGEVMVVRKCPDFVHKNKKIAIEVYYRRHKELFGQAKGRGIKEWKAERAKIFTKEGWQIIFFDETQVKPDIVKSFLMGGD